MRDAPESERPAIVGHRVDASVYRHRRGSARVDATCSDLHRIEKSKISSSVFDQIFAPILFFDSTLYVFVVTKRQ